MTFQLSTHDTPSPIDAILAEAALAGTDIQDEDGGDDGEEIDYVEILLSLQQFNSREQYEDWRDTLQPDLVLISDEQHQKLEALTCTPKWYAFAPCDHDHPLDMITEFESAEERDAFVAEGPGRMVMDRYLVKSIANFYCGRLHWALPAKFAALL